jgi:hypothetical protein
MDFKMATKYRFVNNINELTDSTLEFYDKPEFWKATLGSGPKYFVHVKNKEKDTFGLSKFCAFKNITVEEYLKTYRYLTHGGTTQKHISWLTGQDWKPRNKIRNDIRESFDNWILQFFPNYNLNNASFITLRPVEINRKKLVTPKDLQENLRFQEELGQVGEEIAISFEIQRLKDQGFPNPYKYIDQVSKMNSAAGYDIYSSTDAETRYIEVKSSLNNKLGFFITENEVHTLETLGNEGYIYMVHITDVTKRKGAVFQILPDPIKKLREKGKLKPIAYRAEVNTE